MNFKKLLIVICIISFIYFIFFRNKPYHPYYSFDKVEYYKIDNEFQEKDIDNGNKKIIDAIVLDWDKPRNLKDSIFLKNLKQFSFSKKVINPKYFVKLNTFFTQQDCDEVLVNSCMLYFRDILVFYKNEKISGITKICFGCNESVLIGTKYDADTFGQCGVYSKLKSFLAKAI